MGPPGEPVRPPPAFRDGRFEVLEAIGHGAMGTVYRGRDHERGGAEIALKVLDPRVVGSKVEKRFLRESDALRTFSHPNIVKVHEVGSDGGYVWMAMELMDRGNTHQLVKKRGPLPVSWCLHIADGLLSGLEYVHDAGYVHRDLKPANVLLDSKGAVKLGDFGILRDDGSDLTAPGMSLGTLSYMSPEQTEDARRVTPRSDLYSLGATLFALSTGKAPKQLAWLDDPVPGRDGDPAGQGGPYDIVPHELRAIVRRACAFSPSRRYGSAAEMRAAVREGLGEHQRKATPAGA